MAKQGRRAQAQVESVSRRRLAMGLGVVGILVAAGVIVLLARPGETPPITDTDAPSLGDPGAPLTVYYFGDFQCPACRLFETTRMDTFRETHIDPGRVRLVFKDFPFIGDDSWTAAQASHFVWKNDPGSYWAWHRAIYEQQGPERSGWASIDNLVTMTRAFPDIDAEAMRADVLAGTQRESALRDRDEGRAHGVSSTPTLVIGERLVNANDDSAVAQAIAEASP